MPTVDLPKENEVQSSEYLPAGPVRPAGKPNAQPKAPHKLPIESLVARAKADGQAAAKALEERSLAPVEGAVPKLPGVFNPAQLPGVFNTRPQLNGSAQPAHHMDDAPLQASTQDDPVNHPRHYTSHPSGVECITVVEHMTFNAGSAIKYVWRAGLKGNDAEDKRTKRIEDLKKARWYLDREIERLEKL